MTENQKAIFIQVAQMGMACSLTHPWEWLANALRQDWLPFDKRQEIEESYIQSFIEFWRGCGSCPEDPCQQATAETLMAEVNRYYNQRKEFQQ